MPQLTYDPMRLLAQQSGALHYWSLTGAVTDDAISGLPATATGSEPFDDPAGRDWLGPVRLLRDGKIVTHAPVPLDSGAVFFRAHLTGGQAAGPLDRGLLRFTFPGGTIELTATRWAGAGVVLGLSSRLAAGGFGPYQNGSFPAVPDGAAVTLYCAASVTPAAVEVVVLAPGHGAVTLRVDRLAGVPEVAGVGGWSYGMFGVWNLHTAVSNLTILPRPMPAPEAVEWARLLELGRRGDGALWPRNNSRGLLAEPLGADGRLASITGGTLAFAAPGPAEEGRITLVDPNDPSVVEVCALLVNDGTRLELRRGEEGTLARDWPAGTPVNGWLTQDLLARRSSMWVPEYRPGQPEYGPDWASIPGRPSIPATAADVGAAPAEQVTALSSTVSGVRARVVELEKGPTWKQVRDKPQIPSAPADIGAASSQEVQMLRAMLAALTERVAVLEAGQPPADAAPELTDSAGRVLTDSAGRALAGPAIMAPGALTDRFGGILVDRSGNILSQPAAPLGVLADSAGSPLADSAGRYLMPAAFA